MSSRWVTKPVVIEAVQYDGQNIDKIVEFIGEDKLTKISSNMVYAIKTLEGNMMITKGDYIIKGLAGEFYPCKPDIFHMKYENEEELQCIQK